MTAEDPPACSLDADELQLRLERIAAVGADSLIERRADGERHLLHFRPTEEIRRRLEQIVAAEARCCPFLDLSLSRQDERLILSIGAPASGQQIVDELAAAFGGT
jgi:hypothetical protein